MISGGTDYLMNKIAKCLFVVSFDNEGEKSIFETFNSSKQQEISLKIVPLAKHQFQKTVGTETCHSYSAFE